MTTSPTPTPAPPAGRVWLEPDQLACDLCGRAVPRGHNGSMVADTIPVDAVKYGRLRGSLNATFGRCSGCAGLRVHARQLDPGADPAGEAKLARSLAAWRVLRLPLPNGVPAAKVELWFARFEPDWAGRVFDGTEDARQAAAEPWSHIGPEQRAALTAQMGRWQHTRAHPDRPVRVPAPRQADGRPGGCAFCGIGSVRIPAAYAHNDRYIAKLWITIDATSTSMGGTDGQRVRGALCPDCEAAAMGPSGPRVIGLTTMEESLAEFWISQGHTSAARDLRAGELAGTIGWAVTGREPSRSRWAHMRVPEELDAAELDAVS